MRESVVTVIEAIRLSRQNGRNSSNPIRIASPIWRYLTYLLVLTSPLSIAENRTAIPVTHGAVQQANLMEFNDDGTISGFKHHFVEALAQRLNWSTQHRHCPFQRCLYTMADGTTDLMVFVTATQDRHHYLDFIQVWPNTRSIPFYVRQGEQSRLQRYEDLHQLRVGVVNGYVYFPRFDKDPAIEKITVIKETQLARMLLANRIDTYIAYDAVSPDDNPDQSIVRAPYAQPFKNSAFLAISKKSPLSQQLDLIEQTVIEMMADGTIETLWRLEFPDQNFPYPLEPRPRFSRSESAQE